MANINLGSGIIMSQAGVEIKGGTTNSVEIVGAVDLSNPDITLAVTSNRIVFGLVVLHII